MAVTDDSDARQFAAIFPPPFAGIAFAAGVLIAVAHLYAALIGGVAELTRNAFHFAGFAFLAAITLPMFRGGKARLLDFAIGVTIAGAAIYLAFAEDAIYDRGVRLSTTDWIAGAIVLIGALEVTRRAAGPVIPILMILALTYVSVWGSLIGGVFRFPGLSYETVMFRSIYGDDALFGTIARISSTYVFLFIIFGAFLLRSGAGEFVINLSRVVAGRLTGGPGLVAVIASALTGTISGSAVANTASTGVITIPLMRKAGFPAQFAAGVEAAASTGGQLMPPIMGAGAFVMASYTQIPYEQIVVVAFLPAILYFASVAFFVRIEARRQGLGALDGDGPSLAGTLRHGGLSFIIPIAVVIGLLVAGFTPSYAAVVGIVSVVVASWLSAHPMGPRAVVEALALGARNMIPTAVLLCSIGVVVNVIATAGVGNTFSLMVADWSSGSILIALVLIGLASLVLGMGLPVTAAYIVLATLSAPALAGMIADGLLAIEIAGGNLPEAARAILLLGLPEAAATLGEPLSFAAAQAMVAGLPFELSAALREIVLPPEALIAALLSAHMVIFWLSQDSNVTPPVCLAAFTAAAIAKSPPMATGLASWKIAKGLYIVPILLAYTPILSGDWPTMLTIFAFALVGIYGLAGALQGWMEARLPFLLRIVAGAGGVACLWPNAILVNFVGLATVAAVLALNLAGLRSRPAGG